MSETDYEIKSKSQHKREHLALQALGKALVELPESLLKRLPLSDRLREEVKTGRRLQRGALQRQLRHLGGVLETEDHAAIRAALKVAVEPGVNEIRRLHELEALRDALLRDGDKAIETLTGRYPDLDRQQLRQLVRNARQEQAQALAPRATRALFQFLKQLAVPTTAALSRVDQ
jgi:ribosome-associated protein